MSCHGEGSAGMHISTTVSGGIGRYNTVRFHRVSRRTTVEYYSHGDKNMDIPRQRAAGAARFWDGKSLHTITTPSRCLCVPREQGMSQSAHKRVKLGARMHATHSSNADYRPEQSPTPRPETMGFTGQSFVNKANYWLFEFGVKLLCGSLIAPAYDRT